MEVQNDSLSNVITAGVVGFLGALLMIGLFYLYENKFWMVKQFYRTVLKKLIPSLYIQTQVHSESVTLTSRVNCQSVVIIGEYSTYSGLTYFQCILNLVLL